MKDTELERNICTLIRTDPKIDSKLKADPDAELIPFGGTRERFYLLVSLLLSNDTREFAGLSYVVRKAAALVVSVEKVKTLPGIEVVCYIESLRPVRVFRLVVHAEAFSYVEKLTDDDLLMEPLYDGIRSNWFVSKPESATDYIDV